MEINHKLLEKISRLSALKIDSSEESQELKDYLTKTLSYFEQIREIDTKKNSSFNQSSPSSFETQKRSSDNFYKEGKTFRTGPSKTRPFGKSSCDPVRNYELFQLN